MSRGKLSSDAQIVDALERSAAPAADQGMAIAADQRVGRWRGAHGAVEFDGSGFGHKIQVFYWTVARGSASSKAATRPRLVSAPPQYTAAGRYRTSILCEPLSTATPCNTP
jgi:hypothetical protein